MRYKTEEGVIFKTDEEGIDIIANDDLWNKIKRADVYIQGLSIKLTKKDKEHLQRILS